MKRNEKQSSVSIEKSAQASEVDDNVTDVGISQAISRKRNEKSSESWAKTYEDETPPKE
jgi:hypothetical protein